MLTALIAATLIALLSLTGVVFFGSRGHLTGTNRVIVPVAIGVFLGVVFFELIPETIAEGGESGSIAIVAGFVAFYLLSHFLHTFHHHHESGAHDDCEGRAGASLLLIGDAVHNFADGIVIATAFLIDPAVGIAATVGVALHEIPQEIAEFGVLRAAGYNTLKASLLNLLSASTVILGTFVTFLFAEHLSDYIFVLTGLAAGNLLYIAASDLLPDVHEESRKSGTVLRSLVATLIGLVGIVFLLSYVHERFEHEAHEDHDEQAEASLPHDTDPERNHIEQQRSETERVRQENADHAGPLEAI